MSLFRLACPGEGAGYDDMTITNNGKNRHHASATRIYDDMTIVHARAHEGFASWGHAFFLFLYFIKQSSYRHNLLKLKNDDDFMTIFAPKIVMEAIG